MAVKIRLKRMGKIRQPHYRVVVVDSRKKRDGRVIEEIGKFKHPTVVTLMVELIGRPTSKALPMDWLRAHEDFARPHLDQLAKGRGKLAEKAQMAQSML